jgi:hypothetical protein
LLSTFLLMFMFCTRISKNRNRDSGNLFDPWNGYQRKHWLGPSSELNRAQERSRDASDEQSARNIQSWNTALLLHPAIRSWQSVYLDMTICDKACRIRMMSGSVCLDYSRRQTMWVLVSKIVTVSCKIVHISVFEMHRFYYVLMKVISSNTGYERYIWWHELM